MTPARLRLGAACASGTLLLSALVTAATAGTATGATGGLDLGADNLQETRTTTRLQPGVTLTTIVRGHTDTDESWTVETAIPAGPGSPDPDAPPAAISDRDSADASAQRLRDAGFTPRVEGVTTEQVADFGGFLGYRVRVGTFPDKAAADATLADIRARTGLGGSSVYTGWDPDDDSTGPWHIHVLTIDPDAFDGSLVGSYGPDLERRERTSELAVAAGATAGVNAGFFVLDPASGAPGDPAGVGVYGGRLESETVDGRPVLVFGRHAENASVQRLHWTGTVSGDGGSLALDGLNRVPGLIRNCGGLDDVPTVLPLHDFTCRDDDEVVRFTGAYGAATPSGPGTEAVLDARGVVLDVRSPRGGPVPPGGSTLQATGSQADALRDLATVGSRLQVTSTLAGADGSTFRTPPSTYVLNGAPELVDNGRQHVTPRADGMVHPGDPAFYYGFAHKRNPRTLAGVDAAGRLLLVTADGRSTDSLGLSMAECGAVAQSLGMRDAVNLDGGGSTTMVVDGRVVNRPSDSTGERPVGDAVLVLPR